MFVSPYKLIIPHKSPPTWSTSHLLPHLVADDFISEPDTKSIPNPIPNPGPKSPPRHHSPKFESQTTTPLILQAPTRATTIKLHYSRL